MSDRLRVHLDAHQIGRRQTGNETYVKGLLTEFAGRQDLAVTALVQEPALADPAVAGFGTISVPRSGLLRLGALSLAALRIRPDLLHAIYFAPYLAGVPAVVTVHDISYELHPEFFSRAERWLGRTLIRDSVRRAQVVITVSETSRRDIIERYGTSPDRVVAIPNGVDHRFLDIPERPVEPVGDRPLRVLAVGTLQPRKNLMRLLAAVRRVAAVRPIRLSVVGPDGYQAARIRDALDGSAEVEVVGYVSDGDLVARYAAADMLVYPSIYEGFGLPVIESMACGTPVITSTGGSLPEIAGDAALIVDPFDVSALEQAILRVADDVDLRRQLITQGRERARQYTWARSAEGHIKAYRAALEI